MKISDKTVEAVRAANIMAVVEALGSKVARKGPREGVTTCPWHHDTNPSLTLNSKENLCYCFSCCNGGDSISYTKQLNGDSFVEAVERIARLVNIDIEYQDDERSAEIRRQFAEARQLTSAEHGIYRNNLCSDLGCQARDYLGARGILAATSKTFELGYASRGFFSQRITIPIHDYKGEIVGFSGRAIGKELPKYKNSPNNVLFNKSHLVFNEHRAKRHAIDSGAIIFVEGYFDVISMTQHGISNVVAMMGVGAPERSLIKRLSTYAKRFVLCYDGDSGGITAINRFTKNCEDLIFDGSISVSVATIPEGEDPDSLLRLSKHRFMDALNGATPWIDWKISQVYAEIDFKDSASITRGEESFKEITGRITSLVLRQYYIEKIASLLCKTSKDKEQLVSEWSRKKRGVSNEPKWMPPAQNSLRIGLEAMVIDLYLSELSLRPAMSVYMHKITHPPYIWLRDRIFELAQLGLLSREALVALLLVAEPHLYAPLIGILKESRPYEDPLGCVATIERSFADQNEPA